MEPRVEAEALEAIAKRELASLPLEQSQLAVCGIYSDPQRHEQELSRVLRRSWIPLVRSSAMPEVGSYCSFTVLGEPIVVVRGADNALRIFSNVCLHRGAQIMRSPAGQAEHLRCAYHGFQYGHDGVLKSMPCADSFAPQFQPGSLCLPQFPHCEFGGWVWIWMEGESRSFHTYAGAELLDELANWPLAQTEVIDDLSLDCEFDWKIGIEAFLEPLHVPSIHSRSAHPVIRFEGMAARSMGEHSRMALPFRDPMVFASKGVLGHAAAQAGVSLFPKLNRLQRSAHMVYFLFPCTVWMFFPHHYLHICFLPLGAGRSRLLYELHALPQSADAAREFVSGFSTGYRKLLEEDLENLPFIQRAIVAKAAESIRIGAYEERISWFRQALAKRLGQ